MPLRENSIMYATDSAQYKLLLPADALATLLARGQAPLKLVCQVGQVGPSAQV